MITKDSINDEIDKRLSEDEDSIPIPIAQLKEVIERLAQPSYKSKITSACQDDGAIYAPMIPLSKLIILLMGEDNLSKCEEIILSSTVDALCITVIQNEAFEEDLIKYARHAGFSIYRNEKELRLQISKFSDNWTNLYAENRNKLLSLFGLTVF